MIYWLASSIKKIKGKFVGLVKSPLLPSGSSDGYGRRVGQLQWRFQSRGCVRDWHSSEERAPLQRDVYEYISVLIVVGLLFFLI